MTSAAQPFDLQASATSGREARMAALRRQKQAAISSLLYETLHSVPSHILRLINKECASRTIQTGVQVPLRGCHSVSSGDIRWQCRLRSRDCWIWARPPSALSYTRSLAHHVMDDSLNALSNILSQIAEQPYNVTLHLQHIHLAQSNPGLDTELKSAMEMMTEFLAADPEHVWLPLVKQKEFSVDLETASGVEELLALYERAEKDYLCEDISARATNCEH